MRIVAFLLLLVIGLISSLIALIMMYGLPATHAIEGPVIAYLPMLISALLVMLSVLTIMTVRVQNPPPFKEPNPLRWLLLVSGLSILLTGWLVSMLSLFAPDIFGSKDPIPDASVIIFIITAVFVSVTLYVASKMNHTHRPNLIRYLVLLITAVGFFLTTSLCLVLMFAVPGQPLKTYPFLAALTVTSYLPFSFLVYLLAKSFFSAAGTGRDVTINDVTMNLDFK